MCGRDGGEQDPLIQNAALLQSSHGRYARFFFYVDYPVGSVEGKA